MFEEQDEPLEMGGFQLAVDTIKRMRNGVGDLTGLKVALQREDVIAKARDLMAPVLGAAVCGKLIQKVFALETVKTVLEFRPLLRIL